MDGGIQAYQTADTLGRSQLDLILKVYDGALKSFNAAMSLYNTGDIDGGSEELERAKRFVTHLYTTLDFEQGGEVALNLAQVYVHIINETNVIQATKSQERIQVVADMLNQVRSGWQELKEAGAPQAASPEPATTGPAGGSLVVSG